MAILDNFISKQEISQARTPKEFVDWFEEKIKFTEEHKELFNIQSLSLFTVKKFYEELFPLYRLLQHKEKEWANTKIIAPIFETQNFDVKIETSIKFIPKYIEITQADMNTEEYLRTRYRLEHGSVSVFGKVTQSGTKKTGLRISVKDEAIDGSELIFKKKEQIEAAIKKKINVIKRPDDTALLVYFDDYIGFSQSKDKRDISVLVNSVCAYLRGYFIGLFVVGASGKNFWQKLVYTSDTNTSS